MLQGAVPGSIYGNEALRKYFFPWRFPGME